MARFLFFMDAARPRDEGNMFSLCARVDGKFQMGCGLCLFFGFTVDVDRAAAVWFLYFLYEGRSFFGWSKIRKGIFLMIHNSEKSNF